MKLLEFEGGGCRGIRELLDSYLSDELAVESNHAVHSHVEKCEGCARELAARNRLRGQLRRAVTAAPAPEGLRDRVRAAIDQGGANRIRRTWMLATAASLGILAAGWAASLGLTGYTPIEYIAHEIYIRELCREVSQVARLGLGDHVHCAYFRQFGAAEQSAAKTLEELGPSWAPLSEAAADSLPADWGIRLAHRCSYGGREFVHLAMTGPQGLASLIITQRQGDETLAAGGRETAAPFRIRGFSSGEFLGFVVSAMSEEDHERMAGGLVARVGEFLTSRRPAWNA